jgi:hypothetical protein
VFTVTGLVSESLSADLGHFSVNAGKIYSVFYESIATQTFNLRGGEVPRQFIQVGGKVTVTGRLSGSTITATRVLVWTTKDRP